MNRGGGSARSRKVARKVRAVRFHGKALGSRRSARRLRNIWRSRIEEAGPWASNRVPASREARAALRRVHTHRTKRPTAMEVPEWTLRRGTPRPRLQLQFARDPPRAAAGRGAIAAPAMRFCKGRHRARVPVSDSPELMRAAAPGAKQKGPPPPRGGRAQRTAKDSAGRQMQVAKASESATEVVSLGSQRIGVVDRGRRVEGVVHVEVEIDVGRRGVENPEAVVEGAAVDDLRPGARSWPAGRSRRSPSRSRPSGSGPADERRAGEVAAGDRDLEAPAREAAAIRPS